MSCLQDRRIFNPSNYFLLYYGLPESWNFIIYRSLCIIALESLENISHRKKKISATIFRNSVVTPSPRCAVCRVIRNLELVLSLTITRYTYNGTFYDYVWKKL